MGPIYQPPLAIIEHLIGDSAFAQLSSDFDPLGKDCYYDGPDNPPVLNYLDVGMAMSIFINAKLTGFPTTAEQCDVFQPERDDITLADAVKMSKMINGSSNPDAVVYHNTAKLRIDLSTFSDPENGVTTGYDYAIYDEGSPYGGGGIFMVIPIKSEKWSIELLQKYVATFRNLNPGVVIQALDLNKGDDLVKLAFWFPLQDRLEPEEEGALARFRTPVPIGSAFLAYFAYDNTQYDKLEAPIEVVGQTSQISMPLQTDGKAYEAAHTEQAENN